MPPSKELRTFHADRAAILPWLVALSGGVWYGFVVAFDERLWNWNTGFPIAVILIIFIGLPLAYVANRLRTALTLNDQEICYRSLIALKRIKRCDIQQIKWEVPPAPPIGTYIPSPRAEILAEDCQLSIDFNTFTADDALQIVGKLKRSIPVERQLGWANFEADYVSILTNYLNAVSVYEERVRAKDISHNEVLITRRRYDIAFVVLLVPIIATCTAMTLSLGGPGLSQSLVLLVFCLLFWIGLRSSIRPGGEIRLRLGTRQQMKRHWGVFLMASLMATGMLVAVVLRLSTQ